MTVRNLITALLMGSSLLAQTPDEAWPTYNGDYSGRRFSGLTPGKYGQRGEAGARVGYEGDERGDRLRGPDLGNAADAGRGTLLHVAG